MLRRKRWSTRMNTVGIGICKDLTMKPSITRSASMSGIRPHINGMESFWATLKRAYHGTFHKLSPQHLERYIREFSGRHNLRDEDTLTQMVTVAQGMVGKRLRYHELVIS